MAMTPDSGSVQSKEQGTPDSHSLSPSITDYPLEFGRTYHRYHQGSYLYPNDAPEIDRQLLQHNMMRELSRGRTCFSPLSNPGRILDVGTGTGIWPIEMSELYPNAEISCTDLSPVQPTSVPENVHFYIDDAMEDDWLWPPDHFDLIHASILLGSLSSYQHLIRNAFTYLKPGGYFESHEFELALRSDDDSVPSIPPEDDDDDEEEEEEEGSNGNNANENETGDSATPSTTPVTITRSGYSLLDWMRYFLRATTRLHRPVDFTTQIAGWMREAGFVDVHERIEKLPINSWPRNPRMKRLGTLAERNWLEGIAAFSYAPFGPRGLGWTQEEIEGFLVEVRHSVRNREVHAYQHLHIITGRKPDR